MNKLPRHNGKPIETGHYYGGGGGGGCYSGGFPIHLAGAREKPRKRGASVAVGLLLLMLGFAAGHATAGERWDRVKGFARDHWKPIVGCVAAPALFYKESRRSIKRAQRSAQRRAAAHDHAASVAYATRFDGVPILEQNDPSAEKDPGFWKGNDKSAGGYVLDQNARELDRLYYVHSTRLWDTDREGSPTHTHAYITQEAREFRDHRTARPGQEGYYSYLDKLDERDRHLSAAWEIRGSDIEGRDSLQRSVLAVATTLCAFTIKSR